MIYYVYEHLRNDTGKVFYVGKGSDKRINVGANGGGARNRYWKNIVNKSGGFTARKIAENMDNELANLVEMERIDQLKILGYKLANITNGGDGTVGIKHTQETKDKISKNHKELYKTKKPPCLGKFGKEHPAFGHKHSEETRKSISKNSSMKRPEVVAKISGKNSLKAVTVKYNGIIFNTITELATYLNVNRNTVGVWIHRNPKKYGIEIMGNTKEIAKGAEYYGTNDLTPFQQAIE